MKPLYIIVHYETNLTEGIFLPEDHFVRRELTRIMRDEEYILVNGDPSIIPLNLPRDRPLRVCGQMWGLCVQTQHQALQKSGYVSQAYRPASLDSEDIPDY